MNNYKKIISIIVILIGVTVNNSILAQYIIEQTEQEIPIDYSLIPEDLEFDSFEEESNFYHEH